MTAAEHLTPADASPERDTRTRLLDAGVSLFHDLTLADVLAGLNVSKVSRRARVTRPTFYAHFPTQADYVDALLRHVLDPARIPISEEIVRAVTSIATRNEGVVDALRTILHHDLESLGVDSDYRFELVTWAKSDDPRVGSRLSEYYREMEDDLGGAYSLLLQRWGREPRPPLTLGDLAVALDALAAGLAQRRMIDPDLATPDLFTSVVLLLLPRMTRRIGDDTTVDDLVAEIERFPYESLPAAPPTTGRPRAGTREQILHASEALASDRAWIEISLDEIVAAAATTRDELVGEFGSRAGLGAALLERRALAAIPPAAEAHDDPVASLRTALVALRRVCTTHVGFTLGAVGVAVGYLPGDDVSEGAAPVVRLVAGYVAAAQEAGALAGDPPAATVATSLVRAVLTDTTTGGTPGLEPEQLLVDALTR